jgi:hypothetical protein
MLDLVPVRWRVSEGVAAGQGSHGATLDVPAPSVRSDFNCLSGIFGKNGYLYLYRERRKKRPASRKQS